MSEVIVRMEMPMPVKEWNCLDCKAICTDLMRGYYCGITKKTIDTLKNMRARPDWCPIVGELPEEHGDLIDRTLLFADLVGVILSHSGLNFSEVIARQDAVIAAERKDNEQIH